MDKTLLLGCTHFGVACARTGDEHASHHVLRAMLLMDGAAPGAAFIGALAYLGPKAGRDVFGISGETADLVFGAVTVVTGVFGTLAGGLLLDALGASMANGLLLCAGGMLAGWATAAVPPA